MESKRGGKSIASSGTCIGRRGNGPAAMTEVHHPPPLPWVSTCTELFAIIAASAPSYMASQSNSCKFARDNRLLEIDSVRIRPRQPEPVDDRKSKYRTGTVSPLAVLDWHATPRTARPLLSSPSAGCIFRYVPGVALCLSSLKRGFTVEDKLVPVSLHTTLSRNHQFKIGLATLIVRDCISHSDCLCTSSGSDFPIRNSHSLSLK
mmetsp:Transcript_13106/g.24119  ORF Transcript_13106/g.24119 Transcript_13106/m.24119 type:complete len:205 (-) Transcript_13106:948-1562(-)